MDLGSFAAIEQVMQELLGDGTELDLTREQFDATEIVQAPDVVDRPPDLTRGRLYPQYQALSRAVRAGLRE